MPRDSLVGPILHAVREGGPNGRSLLDVVRTSCPAHFLDGQQLAQHTGGHMIAYALRDLVSVDLIILKQHKSKYLIDAGNLALTGHSFIDFLFKENLGDIFATVTPRLAELQRLLGFSVTDMMEAARGDTIRVSPFFGQPERRPDLSSNVFVLMPFVPEFKPVYDDHILPVCTGLGLTCRRADDFFHVGKVVQDIWSAIFSADWIIADCTGRNPNVFYEIGIAHTLGKQVILIVQDEKDVPFDVRHIRYFKYAFTPRGTKSLEDFLTAALSSR